MISATIIVTFTGDTIRLNVSDFTTPINQALENFFGFAVSNLAVASVLAKLRSSEPLSNSSLIDEPGDKS